MCSPGYQSRGWAEYLSVWSTKNIGKGDTADNRLDCWDLAQQHVANAIGIYLDYRTPFCRAITNANKIMPWPNTFPDNQNSRILCLSQSQSTTGNYVYYISG